MPHFVCREVWHLPYSSVAFETIVSPSNYFSQTIVYAYFISFFD